MSNDFNEGQSDNQYNQRNHIDNQQYNNQTNRAKSKNRTPIILGCGCLSLIAMGFIGFSLLMGIVAQSASAVQGQKDFITEYEYTGNSQEKVLIIDVQGVITSTDAGLFGPAASSDSVIEQLKAAGKDSSIKAIVLNMNTPGGEVTATDEIYHEMPIMSMTLFDHNLSFITTF